MNKDLIISKYKELVKELIEKMMESVLSGKISFDTNSIYKYCERIDELCLLQEQEEKEPTVSNTRFISGCCIGEKCSVCGKDATNKLEEVIFDDDPISARHPLTAYVCKGHFEMIMVGSVDQSGIREELIKFAKWYYEWKEIEVANEHTEWVINEYLKSNQ